MVQSKLRAAAAIALWAGVAAANTLSLRQSAPGSAPDFFSPTAPIVPVNLTGDQDFDFQLYLGLDIAAGGGAGTADILNAASYIPPMDMEAFAKTFWALANQTLAAASALGGYGRSAAITARSSYFAASTYFRFADFYLHGDPSDPRLKQLWTSQAAAFNSGLAGLTAAQVKRFTLPTKYNFTIPGYYYSIDHRPRPTMILTMGYDGPQEDFLHWLGPNILDHGWNFVTYEGPGQPTVIHEQGIGFRPDWEVVTGPVIDWLERQPTADLRYLTSVGMSLGGYLAARAAAYEPRIKALVLNGGIYSVFDSFSSHFGSLLPLLNRNNTLFDQLTYEYVVNNPNASTASRWGVEQGLYTFDTRSPSDWLNQCRPYNVSSFINQIKVPTWIVNATQDLFFAGQPVLVYNALKHSNRQATLQTFGGVGGLHNQVGASLELNRAMWTWIDQIWPRLRLP